MRKWEIAMPLDSTARQISLGLALAVGALLSPGPAVSIAQDYPSKTVTIVVPLAPGTGMDTLARTYGEKLSQRLGKPVVVENRPGAATMLGTASVASAAPDGHTLLVATSAAIVINPIVYKQIAYDPERDLVPIAFYVKSPFILIANTELPIRSVPELVKYAKENPAALSYSSIGSGSAQHLSMEFIKQRFDVSITHVPYRNTGQAVTDTIAGHVKVGFVEAGASLPVIREGKVRALAVSSLARLPSLPDVPTFAEASGVPDIETVSWHVLFAPSKTPQFIVDRLHQEMKQIMAEPDVQQRIVSIGLIPNETPSIDGIRAYIKSEREKWGGLVRKLGLEGSQ
jgi:tripartite-type tricarboxylate transporter receptor subunit TctC